MAGLNLVDKGNPNSKKQIYEEIEELVDIKPKHKKYNFDFLFSKPRGQKNMGMDSIEEGMFEKGMF
jgi:hypothetical protein